MDMDSPEVQEIACWVETQPVEMQSILSIRSALRIVPALFDFNAPPPEMAVPVIRLLASLGEAILSGGLDAAAVEAAKTEVSRIASTLRELDWAASHYVRGDGVSAPVAIAFKAASAAVSVSCREEKKSGAAGLIETVALTEASARRVAPDTALGEHHRKREVRPSFANSETADRYFQAGQRVEPDTAWNAFFADCSLVMEGMSAGALAEHSLWHDAGMPLALARLWGVAAALLTRYRTEMAPCVEWYDARIRSNSGGIPETEDIIGVPSVRALQVDDVSFDVAEYGKWAKNQSKPSLAIIEVRTALRAIPLLYDERLIRDMRVIQYILDALRLVAVCWIARQPAIASAAAVLTARGVFNGGSIDALSYIREATDTPGTGWAPPISGALQLASHAGYLADNAIFNIGSTFDVGKPVGNATSLFMASFDPRLEIDVKELGSMKFQMKVDDAWRRHTAAARAFVQAIFNDRALIERGATPASLADVPVWHDEAIPDAFAEPWQKLKVALHERGEDWDFWTAWYHDRLSGYPIHPREAKAITAPFEWDMARGRMLRAEEVRRPPAVVNREIKRFIRSMD